MYDPQFPTYMYSATVTHDERFLIVGTYRDCSPKNLVAVCMDVDVSEDVWMDGVCVSGSCV